MKKLKPEEVQEGKVFHNAEESVKVIEVKTIKLCSSPCQAVFFQDVKKDRRRDGRPTGLPMDVFLRRFRRRKK